MDKVSKFSSHNDTQLRSVNMYVNTIKQKLACRPINPDLDSLRNAVLVILQIISCCVL